MVKESSIICVWGMEGTGTRLCTRVLARNGYNVAPHISFPNGQFMPDPFKIVDEYAAKKIFTRVCLTSRASFPRINREAPPSNFCSRDWNAARAMSLIWSCIYDRLLPVWVVPLEEIFLRGPLAFSKCPWMENVKEIGEEVFDPNAKHYETSLEEEA